MNLTDYQTAAALARKCVETGAGVDKESLARAAQEMSAAVAEVNDRLRNAETALRARNIDEAVRLCDLEPNLIESVEVLDLPERDMWQQLAESEGCSLGEPLLIGVAGDLNEAYSLQQPLAELMKRHRLLAIARAPLVERLAVLRKLNEVDPDNISWQQDVESFEKERHKHIGNDLQSAANQGDLAAAQRIAAELNDTPWILPPDDQLAGQARGLVDKLLTEGVYQQLAEIAQSLEQAYMQKDFDWGGALRDEWDRVSGTIFLADQDPIWNTVIPIFDWLDEQALLTETANAHTKALVKLTQMLKRKEKISVIDQQARKVKQLGPIPADVASRIAAYRQSLNTAKKRRQKITNYTIAAVSVFALLLAGWLWYDAIQTEKAKSQIAAIDRHYEAREYQQVVDTASRAGGAVQNNSVVQRQVGESKKILAQRSELIDKLKAALATRNSATLNVITRTEEFADEGDSRPESFQEMLSAINSAVQKNTGSRADSIVANKANISQAIAKAMRELDEGIDGLNQKLKVAEDKVRNAADSQALRNYDALKDQYERQKSASQIATLKSLKEQCSRMIDAWGAYISSPVRSKMQKLGRDLNSAIVSTERQEKYADDFKSLSQSISSRERYQSEATRFIDEFSSPAELSERKNILAQDLAVWAATDAYGRIVQNWENIISSPSARYPRVELQTWDDEAASFVKKYPQFPEHNILKKKIDFTRKVVNRNREIEPVESLRKSFDKPAFKGISYFEIPGGRWGYYREEPLLDSENDIYTFNVIKDSSNNEDAVSVPATSDLKMNKRAKHCACISQSEELMKRLVSQPYAVNWEDSLWDLINHYANADKEIDPLLRYEILRTMMPVASDASSTMMHVAEEDFDKFGSAIPGPINWLDYKTTTNSNKKKALIAIEQLKRQLPALIEDERRVRKFVKTGGLRQYEVIGVLDEADGKWMIQGSAESDQNMDVYVAGENGSTGRMLRLGKIDGGQSEIKVNAPDSALQKGRPVFKRQD